MRSGIMARYQECHPAGHSYLAALVLVTNLPAEMKTDKNAGADRRATNSRNVRIGCEAFGVTLQLPSLIRQLPNVPELS